MKHWSKETYEQHIENLEEEIRKLKGKKNLFSGLSIIDAKNNIYPNLGHEILEIWVIIDNEGREIIDNQDGCTTLEKAWLEMWKRKGSAWPNQEELLMFTLNCQSQGYKAINKKFYLIIN